MPERLAEQPHSPWHICCWPFSCLASEAQKHTTDHGSKIDAASDPSRWKEKESIVVGREKEAPFGRRTVYCLGILVFGLSLTIPSVAAEARYTASLANGGAGSVKHDMPMTASMRKLAHRVLKRVSDDASAETGSSTRIILWDELGRERRRDLLWQSLLSRRSWPLARRVIARAQN